MHPFNTKTYWAVVPNLLLTSPVLFSGRDNTDAEIGLYATLDPARIY